ncbi:unnamed protein product [Paramecium sonneborni]|uniref:Uncharacterized protein n=1 Tax=Paramecium sonneborni TaxID=65129 RepID=A0A8S1NJW2_9CILI|nr:unnamed protein product [Paramecium sonneborni]
MKKQLFKQRLFRKLHRLKKKKIRSYKIVQLQLQINKNTSEIQKLFDKIHKLVKFGDPDQLNVREMVYHQKTMYQKVSVIFTSWVKQDFSFQLNNSKKMKRQKYLQPNITEKQKTEIISDPQGLRIWQ